LKEDGLLSRALGDWKKLRRLSDDYNAKLFLKTNILDSTLFMDDLKTEYLLKKYKRCN